MAYFIDDSDYLAHYGRKGMKWGQHIFTEISEGARKTKETSERLSGVYDRADKYKNKSRLGKFLNRKDIQKIKAERDELFDSLVNQRYFGQMKFHELLNHTKGKDKQAKKIVEKLLDNPDVWLSYDIGRDDEGLSERIKSAIGESAYERKHASAVEKNRKYIEESKKHPGWR